MELLRRDMARDSLSPVMMVVVVVLLVVVVTAGVMSPDVNPELSAPFLGRNASLAARRSRFVVPVALDSPERAEQTRATR